MTDVDTSSYKSPALPSFLDVASKYGGLQQQQQQIQSNQLGIDKQKLDLVNQRFSTIAKQYTGLIKKPDLSQDDITQQIDNDLKLGLIPPDMAATEKAQIPPTTGMPPLQAAKLLSNHLSMKLTQAMSTMEAVNYHLAQRSDNVGNNQRTQPTTYSPKPGEGLRPLGPPIQQQPAPTTVIPTDQGDVQLGPYSYPGTSINPLPVGPNRTRGNIPSLGGNVTGVDVGPDQPNMGAPNQPRLPAGTPTGPVVARSPLFEAGKTQYVQDQDLATKKLTDLKPVLQALPLLDGLQSGPGTEAWNHAVAFLKANGIISTAAANDKTAIYQEVNKKLSQYVQGSGTRSDADLASKAQSSPNVGTQINPALVQLTKDAIKLDRVQAARAGAFAGSDFSQYGKHRSTFPAQVDERAFGLDLMPPDDRKALVNDMKNKIKSSKASERFEANKFFKSLDIVDKQGLISTGD